jgi:hypothetical protein
MRSLDPIVRDHEDLYRTCVGQTQNNGKRMILMDMTDRVVAGGVSYQNALAKGRSDTVTKMPMSHAELKEISKLYDYRLVRKNGVERATYDQIKTLAGTCPFCGFGEVYEVDHYLPKADFPELNIFPKNLVPVCHPCNHIKLHGPPEGADRSLLHPYFDKLPNVQWLFANLVIEAGGPVLHHFVDLDAAHGVLRDRLKYHFKTLNLSERMKVQSARILVELEAKIEERLEALGVEGVKQHFQDEGERSLRRHGNTIETAAYFAAAENDEYCSGSYRN